MNAVANDLTAIVDALPEDEAHEVVDFARFLQQQVGNRAWERILSDPGPGPKLDRFVADALCDGRAESLAVKRL